MRIYCAKNHDIIVKRKYSKLGGTNVTLKPVVRNKWLIINLKLISDRFGLFHLADNGLALHLPKFELISLNSWGGMIF